MRAVFADSYYYLAFVNERDAGHENAVEFSRFFLGRTITTEWVLTEVADALNAPEQCAVFLALLEQLRRQPGLVIVEASHELFERGIALFSRGPDKGWSLTDCTSFVVMEEQGIRKRLRAITISTRRGLLPCSSSASKMLPNSILVDIRPLGRETNCLAVVLWKRADARRMVWA